MQSTFKERLTLHLHEYLDEKIDAFKQHIASIQESRDSDTKSSAGDKFETGRAMADIELGNVERQLNQTLNQKQELSRLSPNNHDRAHFGSLVHTQQGIYFLAISLGALSLEGQDIFCISLSSPIGELLKGKSIGENITFRGKTIQITAIE
ncbi:MAG: 3-oxoacyl-ACP synthase [Cytophagaceae bacterium]|nr:3-oxoacyl-ACP synthase [Cytophagaceae bacterium]|tara:strand:+ start:2255 stop:2707 length:453 start_codon:yes stop_codon:yes gene_type:complete